MAYNLRSLSLMAIRVRGSAPIGDKPTVPSKTSGDPSLPNINERIPPGPVQEPDPRTGRTPRRPGRPTDSPRDPQPSPPDNGNQKAYLAFSGGGWNSHSMLAGMVSGALDALEDSGQPRSLKKLFESVDGIAANSGGSWFLSQLAYSKNYSEKFEDRNLTDEYNTERGFNGQTRSLFLDFPTYSPLMVAIERSLNTARIDPDILSGARDWLSLISRFATFVSENGLSWQSFVEKLAYKPLGIYEELKDKRLGAPRQAWADKLDIVIASALQTSQAVLTTAYRDWYSASTSPMFARGKVNIPETYASQTTPLTFYSDYREDIPDKLYYSPKVLLNGGSGTLYHSNNGAATGGNDPPAASQPLQSEWTYGTNPRVLDATIASSSFLALMAAPKSTDAIIEPDFLRNYIAELTRNLAPSASFSDAGFSMTPSSIVTWPSSGDTSDKYENVYDQLKRNKAAKLADGGYADNTSAANMLRHIQDVDGTQNPFELTIFANSSDDPLTGIKMKVGVNGERSTFTLPTDVAALFGNYYGNNNDGRLIDGPLPWDGDLVISPHIFSSNAWIGESPDWTFSQDDVNISYYNLDVRTVQNNDFGISANQLGKVNLFVASNRDSFAGPITPGYLDSYDLNFDVYRKAIASQGGFEYIRDAFNLANVA